LIESIQALLRLQEIDLCIEAARREGEQLPIQRQTALGERGREEAVAAAAAEELQSHEQSQRQLESELRDVEVLLEKLDAQLYEITSQQALEALQHELAHARTRKSEHEDAILELMEQIDVARDVLARAETDQREGVAAGEAAEQVRAEREQELEVELKRLEESRGGRLGELEAGLIGAYDHARRNRLPAVVFVTERSCPSCRIMISPQSLVDLRTAKTLVTCGSCSCILDGDKVQQAEHAG
jgi:predicted  nucleic acid-binding Zn-ribbon protein